MDVLDYAVFLIAVTKPSFYNTSHWIRSKGIGRYSTLFGMSKRLGFWRTYAVAAIAVFVALAVGTSCGGRSPSGKRVLILGFDGMDHGLATELMAAGRMPNFSRLQKEGSFSALGTSIPPQSPVAWSNFITGMDAGGHGIFDFMHRDPKTMMPIFSMSQTVESEESLKLGKWQIPLSGGKVELLRRGEAFWQVLEDNGIETTIMRIPANFPPSGTASRELSGMGTPDLLGTYGTFSFYTTKAFELDNEDIGGGEVYEVFVEDDTVTASILGPDNPFLVETEPARAEFTVFIDPKEPVVELTVGDEKRVLKVGEWSDWVPIVFDLIPTQSVNGMCRFYLREVRPEFELYVSPVNIDPISPELPISTPASFAATLARETGRFYTAGMPEDTNALDNGVFSRAEFMTQSRLAGDEVIHQYKHMLSQFDDGVLFYYFGNLDLTSHMMWRPMDTDHPAYDPEIDAKYREVIANLYESFDALVGYTLEHISEDTLVVVMSDHGFASWRRAFHLNAWLRDNGYLEVIDPDLIDDPGLFVNVDWSRTRAYGLGFNGLYINVKGREAWGIVPPEEKRAVMEDIAASLREAVDPETGEPVVAHVYIAEDTYKFDDQLEIGPDMVLGWTEGYRCSDASSLGKIPRKIFEDNTRIWSGEHLMDPEVVPGILLTNRALKKPAPRLENLAAAVLAEFGIEEFPRGKAAK
jgi:predicted AlkP superfamily phosphohydrolase/phosphomutase